ncbi:hypothetical protein LXT23_06375 [Pyxidicoccus sp. QH1ED-7-1]|uniref:Kelch repeat-containing protein n=1 Tax=Pyxidicoccus xibeiensis TaxID=2906759 RepID=UPI0020A77F02|nr:kelch repeat-containing protein [Pyxidicoccus xibeiensis]MCP3136955.1 hypothetical protein [Pyxidicoccus xibeiensis]
MSTRSLRVALLTGLLTLFTGCTDTPDPDPQPEEDAGTGVDAGLPDAGSPDGGEAAPPVFTRRPASAVVVEGGGRQHFQVTAEDPRGRPLTFEWSANLGTLQVDSQASGSDAEWIAPGCLVSGVTASFSVTVTNDLGLSSSIEFSVVGLPVCPAWTPTSSLSITRGGHAAVLLPSGKVLVVGVSSTTEVYDPESGTWASAGSLARARTSLRATLLPSGKVLVAGGGGDPGLEVLEVYDPATNTWASVGDLGFPLRIELTATLLLSGKVLVSGGLPFGPNPIETAEVYDPETGTGAPTGSLVKARFGHTATLLPSGKVLVTGGLGPYPGGEAPRPAVAEAEVYDPATGTWSSAGSLAISRAGHTATLLTSGKVLVTGGFTVIKESPTSGMYFTRYLDTAEVYDPATGTWSSTGSLATKRGAHTATLLPSGKVLVTGGNMGGSGSLATTEVYDPETGTWSQASSLTTGRYTHTATLLPSGKVLVVGGSGKDGSLATAELYEEP